MFIKGDYYVLCQRTGLKIHRSEAVKDPYGFIVKRGHEDPKQPQESILPPRVERQPTFVSPESVDVFLGPNDVEASDF